MPTSAPAATSFFTDSGVNATRASPCCCSLGTAILISEFLSLVKLVSAKLVSGKLGMVHPLLLGRTFAKVHFNGKQHRRTVMRITGELRRGAFLRWQRHLRTIPT